MTAPMMQYPKPKEPSPVEIQQWAQGAGNANQQYQQQSMRNTYLQNQATNAYGLQNRQAAYNNRLQRQTFDDPYIGRGIFNSGIRAGGFNAMLTNQTNDQANRDLTYGGQMGQYGLEDILGQQTRDTTLANLQAQELARRTELRTQLADAIKGIA